LLQNKAGNKYEALLANALETLGYVRNGNTGKNYIQPSKRQEVVIPGTYIQPDLIVRQDDKILAILYVTHWSKSRNCSFKFWRTWEETCQQKTTISTKFISINCIFEALPESEKPALYISSSELPTEVINAKTVPISFSGWYPAITYALVETFDITIACPFKFNLLDDNNQNQVTELLKDALSKKSKETYLHQWTILKNIKDNRFSLSHKTIDTKSRYRIGLLHVYLFYRMLSHVFDKSTPSLDAFIRAIHASGQENPDIRVIQKHPAFVNLEENDLSKILRLLSQVFVRKGANPQRFCEYTQVRVGTNQIERIKFNNDFRFCVTDLQKHLESPGFIDTVGQMFLRFDNLFGVSETFQDLADGSLVANKEKFVREHFSSALYDSEKLKSLLQEHAKSISQKRSNTSTHNQNWVFEMLLYMAGLNSAEDIEKNFKIEFDKYGHRANQHSPYGDYAKTVAFLLQGKDICEQWSQSSKRRTLTPDAFRTLAWDAVADCIISGFHDHEQKLYSPEIVIQRYIENKAARIISADLNGFYIMIEHYLGDLCHLKFSESEDEEEGAVATEELKARICAAWQTDMVNKLWGGRPLETWFEGVSKNSEWLIKIQSAQDGNEGHKTKELAGRCRAIRLQWNHEADPFDRSQWTFTERPMKKLALILDGDWNATQKKNLYEAGWDWIGDVAQLSELRALIEGNQ
jgi:hypothetical protein